MIVQSFSNSPKKLILYSLANNSEDKLLEIHFVLVKNGIQAPIILDLPIYEVTVLKLYESRKVSGVM
jgi:hypothetical protein